MWLAGRMRQTRNPSAGRPSVGARFPNQRADATGSSINVPIAHRTADRIAIFTLGIAMHEDRARSADASQSCGFNSHESPDSRGRIEVTDV